MFHHALLQGLHGVFVPLRRGGTNRSNGRLRRETLTHTATPPPFCEARHLDPRSSRATVTSTALPKQKTVEFLLNDACFLSSTYSSLQSGINLFMFATKCNVIIICIR